MFKDTDYGAPPEPSGKYRSLTDAEILESDKFRLWSGDKFPDELSTFTNMEYATMAYDAYVGSDACYLKIGRLIASKLNPATKALIDKIRYESEPVEPVDPEAP